MQMDVECQNQNQNQNQSQNPNYNIYSIVISQVMRDQEQLPSLPSLTLKIRTAIADPNASGDSLAELISIDPSLLLY